MLKTNVLVGRFYWATSVKKLGKKKCIRDFFKWLPTSCSLI